jgi:hypothetical protein
MRDALDFEELSSQWGNFKCLFRGFYIDGILSPHDEFRSRDELQEVGVGGLLRLDEELIAYSFIELHFYNINSVLLKLST